MDGEAVAKLERLARGVGQGQHASVVAPKREAISFGVIVGDDAGFTVHQLVFVIILSLHEAIMQAEASCADRRPVRIQAST